jgi:hypothetical protein
MREPSIKRVEELVKAAKYPRGRKLNAQKLAAIKWGMDWLAAQKELVCVERVIRYTGSLHRMARQLEGSIAKDNPKEFNGMRIEEISRVVVE